MDHRLSGRGEADKKKYLKTDSERVVHGKGHFKSSDTKFFKRRGKDKCDPPLGSN